ncbi:MAG: alpha/beta hydrolase, partial [Thermomicrobiales bacterium]|nr:alpha/beta hydrolase [Thermomicrobiales bacterium]
MLSRTMDIDGIQIAYDVTGDGPVVLLLHGGAVDSSWWGPLVPALAETHQVIAMDSRGHGRSSMDDRQISYARMADDTLELLDLLGVPKVDIVGWSDGAIIAFDLALRRPERIGRIVAYGANFDLGGYRTGEEVSSPSLEHFAVEGPRRYQEHSPHPERWDELLANLRNMWTTEPNWTPAEIASIETPVLVLDGLDEEVIDIEHARLMADLLPNGELLLMPDTGHFAMYD